MRGGLVRVLALLAVLGASRVLSLATWCPTTYTRAIIFKTVTLIDAAALVEVNRLSLGARTGS